MIKRFLEEKKKYGWSVAWYNLRFNLAWRLLGKPKSLRATPRKKK